MALNPPISNEIEAAVGKTHHDSAIAAANYSMDLLGGPYRCFVAESIPRGKGKYLLEGQRNPDA
jgi:hypothetical protein